MEEGGWSSGVSSEAGDFFSEAVPRNFYDLRTMLKNTQHKSRTLGRRTIITFFTAQKESSTSVCTTGSRVGMNLGPTSRSGEI